MLTTAAAATHYLVASDFDQTLSFNDSGAVLTELIGASGFERKVAGLARTNLVPDLGLGERPPSAHRQTHHSERQRFRDGVAGPRARLRLAVWKNPHALSVIRIALAGMGTDPHGRGDDRIAPSRPNAAMVSDWRVTQEEQ